MMQQQTNMSIDDTKNLGKMSEAGKKAYAEANPVIRDIKVVNYRAGPVYILCQ